METTISGFKKPMGTDPVNIEDFNDNTDLLEKELAQRPLKNGDASNMTNTFTQAPILENIRSGETQKVSLGKIMKAVSDYMTHKAVAASGNLSGHVKLSDTYKTAVNNGAAANGMAASQKAVYDSYQLLQDALDDLTDGLSAVSKALGGILLRQYNGNGTTLTSLIMGLTAPCICMTSTELISDKPSGKYGVIIVLKYNSTRAGAACICTDGSLYINAYNPGSSALTGWQSHCSASTHNNNEATTVPLSAQFLSGTVQYLVRANICYVRITGMKAADNSLDKVIVIGALPKPAFRADVSLPLSRDNKLSPSDIDGDLWIDSNGQMSARIKTTGNYKQYFSYPIMAG